MTRRTNSLQKISSVNDILTFGKFKSYQVLYVLDNCPDYLEWAMTENVISVTEEIKNLIYDKLTY